MTEKTELLFENVSKLIEKAKRHVHQTVDLTMCITYYEIGKMIVEDEQKGETRAKYGVGLLKELSAFLTEKFGKGFSVETLNNARFFFSTYVLIVEKSKIDHCYNPEQKSGLTKSDNLMKNNEVTKGQTVFTQLVEENPTTANPIKHNDSEISQTLFTKFNNKYDKCDKARIYKRI